MDTRTRDSSYSKVAPGGTMPAFSGTCSVGRSVRPCKGIKGVGWGRGCVAASSKRKHGGASKLCRPGRVSQDRQ